MTVFLQAAADAYVAPLLVGLTLAFVGQAIASWLSHAGLKAKVTGLCNDMKEMQELHPRQGNPGKPAHDPSQFCGNAECLKRGNERST